MDINRLLSDELSYELLIRGSSAGRTVEEKRNLLRAALRQDDSREHHNTAVQLDPKQEVAICTVKLEELMGHIEDFDSSNRENEYRRISTRLEHVLRRLDRIETTECTGALERKMELLKFQDQLRDRLEQAYRNRPSGTIAGGSIIDQRNEPLHQSLIDDPIPLLPELTNNTQVRHIGPVDRHENSPTKESTPIRCTGGEQTLSRQVAWAGALHQGPSGTQDKYDRVDSRSLTAKLQDLNFSNPWGNTDRGYSQPYSAVMLSKWKVAFDGTSSVFSFLERIEEMRQSRGVTKNQLLRGAAELFSGDALTWFRSIRHRVCDWDDLIRRLKSSFLPHDYEESLWNEIRNRTQHPSEKVVVYVAIMENLFNRLPVQPSEESRIAIVKRNLQPEYLSHLALQPIPSIEKLVDVCHRLEEARIVASRYKLPPTSGVNLVEPELSATRARTRTSLVHEIAEAQQLRENDAPHAPSSERRVATVLEPIVAGVSCWNCGSPGHLHKSCAQPKQKFCYRCGLAQVTVRTCPNCSGNGASGHGRVAP